MRTVALSIAITALAFGCAHERGERAGTATTTSALTSSSLNAPAGCSTDLGHVLPFDKGSTELSPDERVEVQSWANCLSVPELADSTVVLLGTNYTKDETLFKRRAEAVRDELARRGVELSRIVIGTPNAARGGGRLGPENAVIIEISGSTTLRKLDEQR